MRAYLVSLVSALLALAACAPLEWDWDRAVYKANFEDEELPLECTDQCYLIDGWKDEIYYKIPLDIECGGQALFCLWSDEFINIYIPEGRGKRWSYGGFSYWLRKKVHDGKFWLIEESREGVKTKTYFVNPESRAFIMIVHNMEHCYPTPLRAPDTFYAA